MGLDKPLSAAREGKAPHSRAEIVRFVLTGILNTLVGFGIYAGFVMLGANAALALLGATVLGVMFNFFSFGRLTFRRRVQMGRLPRFLAAYTAIYLFNLALLWAVQMALKVGPIAGQFICLFAVAPAAYLVLKHKVFRE